MKILLSLIICSQIQSTCLEPFQWPQSFDSTYDCMTFGYQESLAKIKEIDCFDLCDILRLHLTTYHESWTTHIINDGSGHFYGCICK